MPQNFTDSLKQGFAGIQDKAAKLQQSMKLKSRLGELAKQRTAILADMGAHTLQAYRAGQQPLDETFAQMAAAITQVENETDAVNQELAALEGRTPGCPQCGAPVPPGTRFCGNCGAPQGA
ncbi:MAG TPA: zinc ribbon domain-containing protein [Symbiobacteriaceae bacterium]|nr:zinc ribbon domain-containing protein [Symbiobacteriaceae bacterium]